MEPQDVLADQVADLGPVAVSQVFAGTGVRQRAQVVDQRVDPDPRDLLGIPRDRHPPRLPLTADAEVLETRLDQAPRLVVAEPRKDEVRTLVVEFEQRLLKVREPKEPVLLFDVLRHRSVVGALPVDELVFRDEGLVPDAVQARVGPLVDVPFARMRSMNSWTTSLVLLVSRPDEEVRLRASARGAAASSPRRSGRRTPSRRDPLLRDPIHLRGMRSVPGQEERVLASLAVMAHADVRRNRRVGVPDVRGRVRRRRSVWSGRSDSPPSMIGRAFRATVNARSDDHEGRQGEPEQERPGARGRTGSRRATGAATGEASSRCRRASPGVLTPTGARCDARRGPGAAALQDPAHAPGSRPAARTARVRRRSQRASAALDLRARRALPRQPAALSARPPARLRPRAARPRRRRAPRSTSARRGRPATTGCGAGRGKTKAPDCSTRGGGGAGCGCTGGDAAAGAGAGDHDSGAARAGTRAGRGNPPRRRSPERRGARAARAVIRRSSPRRRRPCAFPDLVAALHGDRAELQRSRSSRHPLGSSAPDRPREPTRERHGPRNRRGTNPPTAPPDVDPPMLPCCIRVHPKTKGRSAAPSIGHVHACAPHGNSSANSVLETTRPGAHRQTSFVVGGV